MISSDFIVITSGAGSDDDEPLRSRPIAAAHGALPARALDALLEQGAPFDYAAVKALAHPGKAEVPHVDIGVPDLCAYDALITMAGAA